MGNNTKEYYVGEIKVTETEDRICRLTELSDMAMLYVVNTIPIFLLSRGIENGRLFTTLLGILVGLAINWKLIKHINERYHRIYRDKEGNIGFNLKSKKSIFHYIGVYYGAVILSGIISTVMELEQVNQSNQEGIKGLMGESLLPIIILVVFIAPIAEEAIFRELLPNVLGGKKLGYIMSALLFILAHRPVGVFGWVAYGIPSMVYTYVKVKEDDLWMSILLHMVTNSVAIITIIVRTY